MNMRRVYKSAKGNVEKILEFRKVFWWMLLSIMLVLFLFVMISMHILNPILEEKAVTEAEFSFLDIEVDVSLLLKEAKKTAIQVSMDRSCSPLLTATNTEMLDSQSQSKGIGQLGAYKSINDNIQSIYIFNDRIGWIFSTEPIRIYKDYEQYPDQEFIEWLIQSEDVQVPVKRTINVTTETGLTYLKDVYTYVLPSHYTEGVISNAVVVNMSFDNIAARLEKYQNQEDVYVAVMDSTDILVQSNTISSIDQEELERWVYQTVEENRHEENKVVAGEKYSIIHYYSDTTKMHFIMIRPWRSIYGIVNYIKEMFVLFVFVLLVLGVLLSFLTSHYVHEMLLPIDKERKEMKFKVQGSIQYLRAKFWQRYLTGQEYYSREELKKTLDELEILDSRSGALSILCLETLEIFADGKRMCVDEVVNNYLEVFADLKPVYLFQQKNKIVFLQQCCLPEQQKIYEQRMVQLREKVPCNLNLLGASEACLLEQYPEVFETLLEAEKQLFFYPYNLFLDFHQVLQEHRKTSNRGKVQLVNQITKAIKQGEMEEVTENLKRFEASLSEESFDSYQNHMLWLVMSVTNTMENGDQEEGRYRDFIMKLHDCKKSLEMHRQICDYFRQLLKPSTRLQTAGRTQEIRTYIEAHYFESELSTDTVAEHFHYSTDYLRKIYKSATGQSVAEYIMQVRMEHAADKIKNTKKSLQEIAVSCGYVNTNYFYTCFKKKHGVTPSNYRAMYHKGEKD